MKRSFDPGESGTAKPRARLPVRAAYLLGELARAASISRWRMRRLLERSNVECVRVGRVLVVPLSELETKAWPIWEGIKAAETLRHATEEPRNRNRHGRS